MPPNQTSSIHILGTGISGLTLARSLKNRIPFTLYGRAASPPHHNYGITVSHGTTSLLCRLLGLEPLDLKNRIAVDIDDVGHDGLRVHCGKLEQLLREGLDEHIKWSHEVSRIETLEKKAVIWKDESLPAIELDSQSMIVDTTGSHSPIRRQIFSTLSQLKILPFVVFRGTRAITKDVWKSVYASHFKPGETIIRCLKGNALFHIQINSYDEHKSEASISYIYSRPAHASGEDPLHHPARTPGQSPDLSSHFISEIAQLTPTLDLPSPFAETFTVDQVREERIIHWLMRSSLLDAEESSLIERELGVVLIGDAAHTMPILGGEGARIAIRDAVELGGALVERREWKGRYQCWREAVERSESTLEDMHGIRRQAATL